MEIKRKISTESALKFQEQQRFYLNEIIPSPFPNIVRISTTAIRGISELLIIAD